MTLSSDQIIDRRRLRRKLGFWRLAAVVFLLLLVVVLAGRLAGGTGPHVALLHLDTTIFEDERWDKALDALSKDDAAKAVIIDINSPGGTTVGSEKIYRGLRKIAAKKPVVAVIESLGASGGYIAALGADRIIAHETSLTGSIGVIMQSAEVSGLLGKIGVTVTDIKSSPLKAEPSQTAPMTDEVKTYLQQLIDDAYQWFIAIVAERRGMALDDVKKVADGRVFTGRQALQLGLVDALGGEDDARSWLASARGVAADLPLVDATPGDKLGVVERLFSSAASAVIGKALIPERLRLDGLVSLWHP
jgi:protease-4